MPEADNMIVCFRHDNIMSRIISTILLLSIMLSLCLSLASPVLAQGGDYNLYGLDEAADQTVLNRGEDSTSASNSIALGAGKILGAFLAFLGVIFLILMIYGGITWMTAGGNEDNVATAKKLLGAGVIGLLIVLAAWALAMYIISRFLLSTGATFDSNIYTN
ncbi:MAG: hypothetical protein ABIG10_01030 [bacterium]